MFGLGFPELILIFVIVIVIFGTSRIPELGKGLGEGIRNFKKGIKEDDDKEEEEKEKLPAKSTAARKKEPEAKPASDEEAPEET